MTTLRSALMLLVLSLVGVGSASAQAIDAPLGGDAPSQAAAPGETPAGRVARTFYDAFVVGDIATMERLYAPDLKFKDEIFTFTDRAGAIGMWRVLLAPSGGGKFSYELLGVEGNVATVRWLADYKFPSQKFGRKVHNIVTARLVVRDGKIVDHLDSFSWAAWSRQAFPLGVVSTWQPVEWVIKASMRAILARSAKAAAAEAARAAPTQAGPTRGIEDRLGG